MLQKYEGNYLLQNAVFIHGNAIYIHVHYPLCRQFFTIFIKWDIEIAQKKKKLQYMYKNSVGNQKNMDSYTLSTVTMFILNYEQATLPSHDV